MQKKVITSKKRAESIWQILFLSLFSFVFAFSLMVAPALATGVYDLPILGAGEQTWVVDQAEVISRANEGKLNNNLKQLAQRTGNEVRFVVVRRLDFDETIEGLADKLFDTWYPTPSEKANQTLVVLDTLTNASAIHIGENIKPLLNDEIASSLINETIAIPLKEGAKYNQALLLASDRIDAILSGKPDPGPPQEQEINIESTFTSAEETDDVNSTIWVIVLLILATVIPMVTYFWYVGFPSAK